MTAVSMQYGWQSFMALRSDSRECPRRIGVGGGGGEGPVEKGLAAGGLTMRSTWACTSASVVVTEARCASVIPDHLRDEPCKREELE